MLLQLNPPIPVHTPKGNALAHVLIDYGIEHHLMFVCFIDETGECWIYGNNEVKAQKNITYGRKFE